MIAAAATARHKGTFLLSAPARPAANLWRHRELLWQLTKRDVAQRYKATYLGALWSYITPLVMLIIYTFVFSVIFRAKWDIGPQGGGLPAFALTLFAGLIAFNVFSEVANRTPMAVLSSPNYVKKVVFPLEILPAVIVCSSVIHSLISVGILVVAGAILLGTVSGTLFLLPLAYLPLLFFCLAIGWFLASLGVYIRDIGQAVNLIVQALFFLTPVFYPVSAMPQKLRPVLFIHPLTTILYSFRQCLLWGVGFDWAPWAEWTGITGVLAMLAYAWFVKTKSGFADVM